MRIWRLTASNFASFDDHTSEHAQTQKWPYLNWRSPLNYVAVAIFFSYLAPTCFRCTTCLMLSDFREFRNWSRERIICKKSCLKPIWLTSYLYLRYRIEDLITLHFKSCSSELCLKLCIFYVMILTNQIAYFKRRTVFLKMTKSFSLHVLSVA